MKTQLFKKTEIAVMVNFDSIFDANQLSLIARKTPNSEVEIKKDKNNFTYKSVKASYVKDLVTKVTGGNYSFKIISHEFISATNEVFVHAKLTIFVGGKKVSREQFGHHYLSLKTETNGNTTKIYPSDMGNGYKAAASDAFKKCASEFGFCWDIYQQEHEEVVKDLPVENYAEKNKLERLDIFLAKCTTIEEIEFTYTRFLETAKETEGSKTLLAKYMKRVTQLKK